VRKLHAALLRVLHVPDAGREQQHVWQTAHAPERREPRLVKRRFPSERLESEAQAHDVDGRTDGRRGVVGIIEVRHAHRPTTRCRQKAVKGKGATLAPLERRPRLAGIAIGCLAIKPHVAVLFPLVLLVQRHQAQLATQLAHHKLSPLQILATH
jgi:hypothetical protein